MLFVLIEGFVLTLLIEFLLIKPFFLKEKVFVPIFLANLLTNPLVVYLYNLAIVFLYTQKDIILVIMEVAVVWVEAYVYKELLKIGWKRAFVISFLANLVAYLVGMAFFN